MGLLLAFCQKSLDKIVIECNQKRQAIFHYIRILDVVGGIRMAGQKKKKKKGGFCEKVCVHKEIWQDGPQRAARSRKRHKRLCVSIFWSTVPAFPLHTKEFLI